MNKELLIFGAYGALGRGITKSLLTKDYNKIYLFDFDAEKKGKNDKKVLNVSSGNLAEEENIKNAFSKINPDKKKIFFLYSTVGGYFGGKNLWDTEVADWDKMFNMNLKSNYLIAKYFANLVKQSGGGSILFTSAMVGINSEENKAAYGASKSALIHLVDTLAKEGKKIKLTVNAIAPYIIDTPANREWMKQSDYESWSKPEEIGDLAHFIFLNFHFITGNVIKLTNRFKV
jgi:NAD(P)-dependent dehydrogenase (short-subunit alcohol dehydrogenase family)